MADCETTFSPPLSYLHMLSTWIGQKGSGHAAGDFPPTERLHALTTMSLRMTTTLSFESTRRCRQTISHSPTEVRKSGSCPHSGCTFLSPIGQCGDGTWHFYFEPSATHRNPPHMNYLRSSFLVLASGHRAMRTSRQWVPTWSLSWPSGALPTSMNHTRPRGLRFNSREQQHSPVHSPSHLITEMDLMPPMHTPPSLQ